MQNRADKPIQPVKVEVLYFEGCPNHRPAVELARQVAADLAVDVEIKEIEVTPHDDPARLRFLGSPTVLVNGVDVEPAARGRRDFGFSCRTYPGGSGVPSVDLMIQAIKQSSQAPARIGAFGGWKQSLLAGPAVVVSFLPTLTCPACWPAYAGLLSALGLGFLWQQTYLLPVTAALLVVALASLAWRASARRGYGPFVLGLLAAAVLLIGKFGFDSTAATYAGAAGLIAASIWNAWPRRPSAKTPCPACEPQAAPITGSQA